MHVEEFTKLRETIQALMDQSNRAAGGLDQVKKRLQEEHQVTLEEAPAKVIQLRKEIKMLQSSVETRTEAFLDRWKDSLETL